MKQKKAIVVFSGGQDSTTCLYWALNRYEQVEAITFQYGQKHDIEIEQSKKILEKTGVKQIVVNLDQSLGFLAESALIYESNMRSFVDKVIYVCVDEQTRIKRTFERSGYTEQEYKQRMKTQINPETKKKLSDFIIYNNEGDNLNEQILNIHNNFVYS
jgi:dephospho-CoA kinase